MSRVKDLTNQKFNLLTAVRFIEARKGNAYWECKCDCGNICIVAGADLQRSQTKSCGCARKDLQASKKFKDLTGKIFGRLTVTRFLRITEGRRMSIYECKCECGVVKEYERANLVRGYTLSCGCYNRDKQLSAHGVASFTHYIRSYKNSAKKRNLVFELTEEQFREIIAKDCCICGAEPKEMSRKYKRIRSTPILVNGIDRIDSTKGYTIDNIQPMCTSCNMAKSNMGDEEFLVWVQKLKGSK